MSLPPESPGVQAGQAPHGLPTLDIIPWLQTCSPFTRPMDYKRHEGKNGAVLVTAVSPAQGRTEKRAQEVD